MSNALFFHRYLCSVYCHTTECPAHVEALLHEQQDGFWSSLSLADAGERSHYWVFLTALMPPPGMWP